MEITVDNSRIPSKFEDAPGPKPRISLRLVANKLLFFLTGASVTCLASTGRLTSKAFETDVFISDCFSVFFYVNIAAFLVALLFIQCNYRKAIISGWFCLLFHLLYIIVAAFGRGAVGRALYITMYAGIAILEAFVIQSNSHVVTNHYSSSYFSSLYAGYYGGMAIFSLIQTVFQYTIGTDTREQARLCLICTHSAFATIVLATVVSQTVIYFKTGPDTKKEPRLSLRASCMKKLLGMYRIFRSLPRYSPRFIVFTFADLCKCAFFQVFIPYRMLLTDSQLIIVFFTDNIADIVARSFAGYADEKIASPVPVTNHRRLLFRRNIPFMLVVALCWSISSLIVWATWTLKAPFLTKFWPILVITLCVGFAIGYCSTRGVNGCIPILEYYSRQFDCEGNPLFPDSEKETFSYVNDLNTFLIKLSWILVFLIVYFLAGLMEKHQSNADYLALRTMLKLL